MMDCGFQYSHCMLVLHSQTLVIEQGSGDPSTQHLCKWNAINNVVLHVTFSI